MDSARSDQVSLAVNSKILAEVANCFLNHSSLPSLPICVVIGVYAYYNTFIVIMLLFNVVLLTFINVFIYFNTNEFLLQPELKHDLFGFTAVKLNLVVARVCIFLSIVLKVFVQRYKFKESYLTEFIGLIFFFLFILS